MRQETNNVAATLVVPPVLPLVYELRPPWHLTISRYLSETLTDQALASDSVGHRPEKMTNRIEDRTGHRDEKK